MLIGAGTPEKSRHEFEFLDSGPNDWSLKHPKECTDAVLAGRMSLLDCPYDRLLRAILTPRTEQ